jgi:hypothetical protein
MPMYVRILIPDAVESGRVTQAVVAALAAAGMSVEPADAGAMGVDEVYVFTAEEAALQDGAVVAHAAAMMAQDYPNRTVEVCQGPRIIPLGKHSAQNRADIQPCLNGMPLTLQLR